MLYPRNSKVFLLPFQAAHGPQTQTQNQNQKGPEVLEFLRATADPETGISQVPAENHWKVPVTILSHSTGSSQATISRKNSKALSVLEGQGGDLDQRLREFVKHPKVAAAAISELYIPCNMGAKATVDFKAHYSLTKVQVAGVRGLGVNLATDEEIREEEKSRQIPLVKRVMELEISKPRPRENVRTVTVSHRSLLMFLSREIKTKSTSGTRARKEEEDQKLR